MSDEKIIFLDIDGVLNHANSGEDVYYDAFSGSDLALNADNIENLKKLLSDAPDSKIVWSTDWRYYDDEVWNKWKNPVKWLESQDFMKGKIAGKTPQKMSSEHFHDIKWWLDSHPDVKSFAILEDSYFPKDWFGIEQHVVNVDPANGLTAADVDSALKILATVQYRRRTRHGREITAN